jgi:hypothetical protein
MEGRKMADESTDVPPEVTPPDEQPNEEDLAELHRMCSYLLKPVMAAIVLVVGLVWVRHHVDRPSFVARPASDAVTVSAVPAAPVAPAAALDHPPYASAAPERPAVAAPDVARGSERLAIAESAPPKRPIAVTPVRSRRGPVRQTQPAEPVPIPARVLSVAPPVAEIAVSPSSRRDGAEIVRAESAAVRESDPEPRIVERKAPAERDVTPRPVARNFAGADRAGASSAFEAP